MSKKIIIPVVVVLIIALGAAGFAYAANTGSQASASGPLVLLGSSLNSVQGKSGLGVNIGQVTALGNNQITVKTPNGEKTISVDAQTRYYNQAGASAAFQDLQIGIWIAGKFERSSGKILAKRILILPQGFNPGSINDRLKGTVFSIDSNAGQFTLKGRDGEEQAVKVDQNTIFLGKVQNLSEMKVNMVAGVGAAKETDGSLMAIILFAHPSSLRHTGSISSVDVNAGTFTLRTLTSGELTFKVDSNTKFISKNKQVKSLADLNVDEVAVVWSRQNTDGSLTAVRVASATKAQIQQWLKKYDVRAAGQVLSVNGSQFTIQTKRGLQMTFQVGSQTQFLSRGKTVGSLAELKSGMKVLVGSSNLGNNQYQALAVVVIKQ